MVNRERKKERDIGKFRVRESVGTGQSPFLETTGPVDT